MLNYSSIHYFALIDNCPMLNIPGFTYPVKEYLLEDVIEELGFMHQNPPIYDPRNARDQAR